MADKKFWRCNVCNDIHYGKAGPEECPTCHTKNAYAEIDTGEAKNVMGL
jgi:rubrerythrin